jgi:DNA-directed RNA polymerase specialized sigma24 family protein
MNTYDVLTLSDEQKDMLQGMLAKCHALLVKAAKRNFGDSTPFCLLRLRDEYKRRLPDDTQSSLKMNAKERAALEALDEDTVLEPDSKQYAILAGCAIRNFGEPDLYRLKQAYQAQPEERISLDITVKEMSALDEIQCHEPTLLAGWMKQAILKARAFFRNFQSMCIQAEEFEQIAHTAIYDGVYTYDGSSELTTYLHWVVHRKLVDRIRSERVYRKNRPGDIGPSHRAEQPAVDDRLIQAEERAIMLTALDMAPLTEYQRAILSAYVECNCNAADVARKRPKDLPGSQSKKITRQGVGDIIRRVRVSVQETLAGLERKQSAA